MSRRAVIAALAAATCALTSLAAGCTSHESAERQETRARAAPRQAPNAQPARTLHQVELPDLSPMLPSVQDQIRERYAILVSARKNPSAPARELAGAYGEMGKLFMVAKYYTAARACFVNARLLVPTDVRWPYYLGHLHKIMGTLADSAAFFEQALQLRPDDVPTLISLGEVHLAAGRPDAAEPLLARALSRQPGSVAARYGLGRVMLARKNHSRAVTYLEEGLALDPAAAGIHYPLAMAYRGLGDAARAEAHLRLADDIEILPADPLMEELDALLASPLVYESRGTLALQGGDYAAAADHFRRGIELAPDNASLRHRLGTALVMMERVPEAVAEFEHALRVSPRFSKAHYSLGLIMEANGRLDDAIERLSTAVRYEPSYVEARLRLATTLRRVGRVQESLSQYEALMNMAAAGEADPRLVEAPFGYALGLVRLGRYREARDWLMQGATVQGGQPVYVHALARLLSAAPDDRVRDGDQALTLMQRLSEEERHIDMGETMAMALAETGQYDQAAAWQQEALLSATRAGRHDLAVRIAQKLNVYERGEPWRSDDPIEFDVPANARPF